MKSVMHRIRQITHRIAHKLGWNLGYVVSATSNKDTVWIGYRCVKCGHLDGIHATHPPKPEEFS